MSVDLSLKGFTLKNGANGSTDSNTRSDPKGFSHQRSKTFASIPLPNKSGSITPRSIHTSWQTKPLQQSMTISRMPTSISLSDTDLRKSSSRASNLSQTERIYNSNSSTVPREINDLCNIRNPRSREEMIVSKATLPKSGLIKLTALRDEKENPKLFSERREVTDLHRRKTRPLAVDHRKLVQRQTTLLSMMETKQLGVTNNLLDNDSLGSYTFGDLQNSIFSYSQDKSNNQLPNLYHNVPIHE